MSQEKHKSQRSVPRLFGQSLDANGNVIGAPVEVRIAHPFVHERRKKSAGGDPLDNPRFDAVILVPKINRDAAQCPNYKLLSDMAIEAAVKSWGAFPQGGKWPIQDGDVPHQQKLKPGQTSLTAEQIATKNKWREGSWVVEVTNYFDVGPKVTVLQNGQAVEIPGKVIGNVQQYKSGDYGYVYMNGYTFHNKTFGVNYGFEGIMFTRPGEAIGGGGPKSAAQMFGGVAPVAAAPAAAPMPAPSVAPQPPVAPAAPAAPAPQQYAPPAAPAPQYAPPSPPVAPAAPSYAPPPAAVGGAPLPPFPPR